MIKNFYKKYIEDIFLNWTALIIFIFIGLILAYFSFAIERKEFPYNTTLTASITALSLSLAVVSHMEEVYVFSYPIDKYKNASGDEIKKAKKGLHALSLAYRYNICSWAIVAIISLLKTSFKFNLSNNTIFFLFLLVIWFGVFNFSSLIIELISNKELMYNTKLSNSDEMSKD